jgi:hypothetical protein
LSGAARTVNLAEKEETPVMEERPGGYYGVIGRQHLSLGKRQTKSRIFEQEETEVTEFFFFCSLFSPFAPVQNSCADNRNRVSQIGTR